MRQFNKQNHFATIYGKKLHTKWAINSIVNNLTLGHLLSMQIDRIDKLHFISRDWTILSLFYSFAGRNHADNIPTRSHYPKYTIIQNDNTNFIFCLLIMINFSNAIWSKQLLFLFTLKINKIVHILEFQLFLNSWDEELLKCFESINIATKTVKKQFQKLLWILFGNFEIFLSYFPTTY